MTRPAPKLLRNLRENVGCINSPAHDAIAALDRPGEEQAAVVEAVDELRHASKFSATTTVTVLLQAALDARADVRAAAASAMSVHPYGPLQDRLCELFQEDPDLGVRAAASKALDDMRDFRPACLQCGAEPCGCGAAACSTKDGLVYLPGSGDPHGAFVTWPVFCSRDCAVEYALDHVRGLVDGGQLHECLMRGEWAAGTVEECDACIEANDVGRPEPDDPEAPMPVVVPALAAPAKPRRARRARVET